MNGKQKLREVENDFQSFSGIYGEEKSFTEQN
jgi:hypothetical protein